MLTGIWITRVCRVSYNHNTNKYCPGVWLCKIIYNTLPWLMLRRQKLSVLVYFTTCTTTALTISFLNFFFANYVRLLTYWILTHIISSRKFFKENADKSSARFAYVYVDVLHWFWIKRAKNWSIKNLKLKTFLSQVVEKYLFCKTELPIVV